MLLRAESLLSLLFLRASLSMRLPRKREQRKRVMKKRVFIGIFASPRLKRKIFDFRHRFNDLPVRWIVEENLHLTLIPPLELSDNEIVEMIEKLEEITGEFESVEIEFDRVCFGPNLRRPRLIWAEGKENFKLKSLKNTITDILGRNIDKRPFRPHLTLARFRPGSSIMINQKIDWQETAKSFCVIQSECLASRARYTNLAEIKL